MKCADEKEGKIRDAQTSVSLFVLLYHYQNEKYRYLVTPWIVNKENQNKHKEMWTGCVTF